MKTFTLTLISIEYNGIKFVAQDSVIAMLYDALEHCENDGERNAVQVLIRGIKGVKKS